MKQQFLSVVVRSPVWQCFDYLPPNSLNTQLQPGMRVLVPFGRRQVVGVIMTIVHQPQIESSKLKRAIELLDDIPMMSADVIQLCRWASDYYHYPLGELMLGVLPKWLREGKQLVVDELYALSDSGKQVLQNDELNKRAIKQQQLLEYLQQHDQATWAEMRKAGFNKATLHRLLQQQWIDITADAPQVCNQPLINESTVTLNDEQRAAVDAIDSVNQFQTFMLAGVTGSGKTEVYFRCIETVLKRDQQILILVPEISLTPQTVTRFEQRFNVLIVLLHSELSDGERARAWQQAADGEARIIIGTRSAIYAPLPKIGMIILDEEHDYSFKQQSGFRYSARDMAVVRARIADVPIILGSATPSLESFHNAEQQRYQLLTLTQRAGTAVMPRIQLLDIRNSPLFAGLSQQLIDMIRQTLSQQQQVMLFLNRRGYAPVLMCHGCGWMVHCQRCDARMTLHFHPRRLCCHHCGAQQHPPRICPDCNKSELMPVGAGTEQIEQVLAEYFPHEKIIRIDRDTVRGKKAMHAALQQINQGDANILIGTQMLAKGHHFSNLHLVAIVDVDGGLFSADFRAVERMAQLIVQVSGRAGREQRQGQVILQTHHPDNDILNTLITQDYLAFARQLLLERQQVCLPPYSYQAMICAEAVHAEYPEHFLREVRSLANQFNKTNVTILGPVPALMARKAGRHRAQLLLQSKSRPGLQKLLGPLVRTIDKCAFANKVKWTVDVDPIEI